MNEAKAVYRRNWLSSIIVVLFLLAAFMSYRYLQSLRVMPAGLVAGLSIGLILLHLTEYTALAKEKKEE
jgi:hypothetical protein